MILTYTLRTVQYTANHSEPGELRRDFAASSAMRAYARPKRPGSPPLNPQTQYKRTVGPSGWKDSGKELLAKVKKQPLTQVGSVCTLASVT